MYQYKAILRSTGEVIHEGHTIQEVEHAVVHFRREQRKGLHTHGNDKIDIYHAIRNKLFGWRKSRKELIKTV